MLAGGWGWHTEALAEAGKVVAEHAGIEGMMNLGRSAAGLDCKIRGWRRHKDGRMVAEDDRPLALSHLYGRAHMQHGAVRLHGSQVGRLDEEACFEPSDLRLET